MALIMVSILGKRKVSNAALDNKSKDLNHILNQIAKKLLKYEGVQHHFFHLFFSAYLIIFGIKWVIIGAYLPIANFAPAYTHPNISCPHSPNKKFCSHIMCLPCNLSPDLEVILKKHIVWHTCRNTTKASLNHIKHV